MALAVETDAFLEDLGENLGAIEAAINSLEADSSNSDALTAFFRAAHTIKGNAAMMGLPNLVGIAHALETVLQECIAARLAVDREAINQFALCHSAMAEMGAALRAGAPVAEYSSLALTDQLQALFLRESGASAPASASRRTVEVRLQIAKSELVPSVRAFLVETKLAELGDIVSKEPGDEAIDTPAFLGSERELVFRLDTVSSEADIREHLNIDLVENISVRTTTPSSPPHKKTRATDADRVDAHADTVSPSVDTIRLSVATLDRLLNLTGDLIIANSALLQVAEELAQVNGVESQAMRLTERNREISRIAGDIQNIVMQSRMLPLEHVFSRFRRFVRDYAETSGKAIRLEIAGEKTELDKRVIDEIVKPLTHLIRNALDHGIEPADERAALGKNREGVLKIAASQMGSSILITVEDDGRGMNIEKILNRAIEKKLVTREKAQRLTPQEIRDFIFMPGFSTKDAADDMSGRGFGMDIVRDSIENLSGEVQISSVEGQGTRMAVKLPLTLAIITALTFKIRNDVFALPLSFIEESLRVPSGSVVRIEGREILRSRGSVYPFVRLDAVLGYPPVEECATEYNYALIVDLHGEKFALGLDEFLKNRDLVVKSLSENYRAVPGLAGASMLGGNEIVFILDLAEVIHLHYGKEHPRRSETMAKKKEMETAKAVEPDSKANEPVEKSPAPPVVKSMFDTANTALVKKWISQSNKTAIKGIQMLTGGSAITVKSSKGSRIKPGKTRTIFEKILDRADAIFLFHLPMLPSVGAIDLIMAKPSAARMAQLLCEAAGLPASAEFDASPLLEITNILGSAYTNTLTFLTERSVEPATPQLLESAEQIRALIAERQAEPNGGVLVVESQFHIKEEDIDVELVIYLNG